MADDAAPPKLDLAPRPTLTRFERARAIGMRAVEIGRNAPTEIDVGELDDELEAATREFYAGRCPLVVRRHDPAHTDANPSYEERRVAAMDRGYSGAYV